MRFTKVNVIHESPVRGRRKRREETITRIVEAAMGIVTEEGFDALTMQRLADELGYAIGAFYRYFGSKDELLLAVQRRVLEQLAADIRAADAEIREHVERSPTVDARVAALARIVAAARVYETLPSRRPAHALLLMRWLADPLPMVGTAAAAPMLPALLELFAIVPALFRAAAEVGALAEGSADRRAHALWSALSGVAQLRKLDRFGVEALRTDALATELVRTLLVGWGADEAALDDAMKRAKKRVPEGNGA